MAKQSHLEILLRQGHLTAADREKAESMWDALARYGKLTAGQTAWVEKEFYKQGLDKAGPRDAKVRVAKVGFAYAPNAKRTVSVSNLKDFERICPTVSKDSQFYKNVADFFKHGGDRFELRAGKPPAKPEV